MILAATHKSQKKATTRSQAEGWQLLHCQHPSPTWDTEPELAFHATLLPSAFSPVPRKERGSLHKPIFEASTAFTTSAPKHTEVQRSLSPQESSESRTHPSPGPIFCCGPRSARQPHLQHDHTHGAAEESKGHKKKASAAKFLNCRGEQRGAEEQHLII